MATSEPFLIKFIFLAQKPTKLPSDLGGHQHDTGENAKNSQFSTPQQNLCMSCWCPPRIEALKEGNF